MNLRQLAICFVLGLLIAPVPCRATSYSITDLGTLTGYQSIFPAAINNNGQITGTAYTGNGPTGNSRAFLYTAGAMQDLGTFGGGDAFANGLNDAGQVTGYTIASGGGFQGFLYSNGVLQNLRNLLAPNSIAQGNSINNLGHIVGVGISSEIMLFNGVVGPLGATNLGNLGLPGFSSPIPRAINNNDQIAGSFYPTIFPAANRHAFVYTSGVLNDLGTLGGNSSAAYAINSLGVVTGYGDLAGGGTHAFLYDGAMHDLGTLGGDSYPGGLNDLGQVVGVAGPTGATRAFLYSGGTMKDLNSMIDSASGWQLTSAIGINNRGQITGRGLLDGQSRAFLLTPVPEPSGLLLAAFAISGILAFCRRHSAARRKRSS